MNILILSSHFPSQQHGGGVRLMNFIKSYSKNNKVSLLSFIQEDERSLISDIKPYCENIETVLFNYKIRKNKINKFKLFFNNHPRWVELYQSKEFNNKLSDLLKNNDYDIVQVEFPEMALYVNKIPKNIFKIYDSIEYRTVTSLRKAKYTNDLEEKSLLQSEAKKTKIFENKIIKKYNLIIAVSKKDQKFFQNNSNIPTCFLPTFSKSIDFNDYKNYKKEYNKLIFLGYYNNHPNRDAIFFFINKIWPRIKIKLPELKFYIVGANPTQEILDLNNNKDIFVTGFVKSLGYYLGKGTIFVNPIRMGGGIKGKLLEAMAYKIPIVSTPEGCEGIEEAKNNKNIIITESNNPEFFANEILKLIKNDNKKALLANNAYNLVKNKYSWQNNFINFENNLLKLLNKFNH